MAKSGGGSGNWLMTYADFITLMMIFFIVLYTFTPGVEKNKWEAIIGAFQGKRGVLSYDAAFSDETLNIEIQRATNWDELYQKIHRENMEDDLEISLIPEGIRIVMGEAALFETYSADLRPDASDILMEVVKGIDRYTFEEVDNIDIQGHTDNRPIRAQDSRKYESNWELGAGRAISVMSFLAEESKLSHEYFEVSSYGEFQPRVENTTPENMRKNRRVEVIIRYRTDETSAEQGNVNGQNHEEIE